MKANSVAVALGTALLVVAAFYAWFSRDQVRLIREPAGTPPQNVSTVMPAGGDARPLHPAQPVSSASPVANSPTAANTPVEVAAGGSSPAPGSTAKQSEPASRNPDIEVNKVHLMLRDYHTVMGGNPVGTNAEIMQALMGQNTKQATFGPPEGMSLNGKGELVDQWGTPYFFHQLSKDVMEIHSAGPDKIMWTPDDIVVR